MPTYSVFDRTRQTTWDLHQTVFPNLPARAVIPDNRQLQLVPVGNTANIQPDQNHRGLVTHGLTYCCAVCVVLLAEGQIRRMSMHHVLGGDPVSVNWQPLLMHMVTGPVQNRGSILKKIVIAWNSLPDMEIILPQMTDMAHTRTGVPRQNIIHYLGNIIGHGSLSFAISLSSHAGEFV